MGLFHTWISIDCQDSLGSGLYEEWRRFKMVLWGPLFIFKVELLRLCCSLKWKHRETYWTVSRQAKTASCCKSCECWTYHVWPESDPTVGLTTMKRLCCNTIQLCTGQGRWKGHKWNKWCRVALKSNTTALAGGCCIVNVGLDPFVSVWRNLGVISLW